MTNSENQKIDASPTKDFFISMLVKDIPLIRAVIDLVDNSIDGARRMKPDENYEGLWIQLELNERYFKISDNCGGIPLEIAQKYAFRFGRPPDAPQTDYSVGQFGVGMKRAIFKFGNKFKVTSSHNLAYFVVEEIISKWASDESLKWEFEIQQLENRNGDLSNIEYGTTIEVSELHDSVSEDFGSPKFQKRLLLELQLAQQNALEHNLHITLNGTPLSIKPVQLLASQDLKPVFLEEKIELGNSTVFVKLYAGISDPDPSKAGWYVYCNGRLILEADQTNVTGWRESGLESTEKDAGVQYHNDFARFRGYVYFESSDTSKLPWNTTKTGVDIDTPIYRRVKGIMISAMTPVLSFLRKVTKEARETSEEHYETKITSANLTSISTLPNQSIFHYPDPPQDDKKPKPATISFKRDKSEVERVKEHLGVSTYREVGEKTYEYYMTMEEIE